MELQAKRLPETVWKRSVLKQLHHRRQDVVPMKSGSPYGRVFSADKEEYVLLSASIKERDGLLPLLRQALAAGCDPVGITAVLLLPEGTPEQTLRLRVHALDQECAAYGLELIQIEPCICSAVQKLLLQVTVVGKNCMLLEKQPEQSMKSKLPAQKGQTASPGQAIVITGWIGMEGTQRLLRKKQEAAKNRFPLHFIRKTEQYDGGRLPKLEQRLALEYGATAMYAAGEDGILDALWQLGERVGCGMEIFLSELPIRQETIEVTDFFLENPYQLASGGVFLAVTEQGNELAERLRQEGLPAAVAGTIQEGRDRVVCFHEERRYLEPYR